ncbi:acyltransferase domain-containing protein [Occultella kanbiaonis]|uniref:acyltransferase domain-containing protein n=1 Tax=Occultella kanbiaonis TaxID=2675754 RepID=UPI00143CFA3F|nr:acyltransferase domain-containing protein [Occultella kanbiaonis]
MPAAYTRSLTPLTAADIAARLGAPDLPEILVLLGLRPEDLPEAEATVAAALAEPTSLDRVAGYANALRDRLGDITMDISGLIFPREPGTSRGGDGIGAFLAFVATAGDVREFHRERGISDAISWRTLGDLGQQMHVHRLTFGEFGLHTQDWLIGHWTGGNYWLGRLQYTPRRRPGAEGIALSAHIPRIGPLTPSAVDASFARAVTFFARHFPDYPAASIHCASWLLDPQLSEVLAPGSNMASFQQRWELTPGRDTADTEVMFFVFNRRGEVDLDTLPQRTTLERAVVAHLRAGGHWYAREGEVPLPQVALLDLPDGASPNLPDGGGAVGRPTSPAPSGTSNVPANGSLRPGRDPEVLVDEFHRVYAMPLSGGAPDVARPRVPMRLALVAEELAELVQAVYGDAAAAELEAAFARAEALDDGRRDTVATADALGDLVYVVYGMAIECGIPLEHVLAEIHRSNLSKLGADGLPILREDGKILKGPAYTPPDLAAVLARHGWTGRSDGEDR